jgi:hypothetical protein
MESDLSTLGALTIQRRAEPAPNAMPLNSAPAAQTLIRLQQSHGNAFVQNLIQNQIAAAAPSPAKQPAPAAPVRPMAEAERTAPGRSIQSQEEAKTDEGAAAQAMTSDLTTAADHENAVAPSTAQATTAGTPSDERSAVKARPSAAPEAAEAKAETAPAAETPAEKVAAEAPSPATDARFQGVMQRLEKTARQTKAHKPASKKVAEARAASAPPDNDRSSRAQANQVEVMDQQEAQKPKTDDFLSMLRAEIARIAPKNMEETEKFKKEGKAAQLKGTLTGQVSQRKDAATQNIKGAAEAKPDSDSVPKKEEIPIPKEPSEAPPPDLHAEDTLPQPKSDAEVSVEGNKKKADQIMAENDVDEEQLKKANEPQFDAALDSKKELEAHADKLPETYRQEEQALLKDAKAKISEDEKDAKGDMKSKRIGAKDKVKSRQEEAKKKEEEERKKVADKIQGMYDQTKKKVEDKLNGLDKEVNAIFDSGEKTARERFESYVDRRMSDYKWDRYIDRIGGSLLWAKDKLFGMPDEVNRFYEEGRDLYLKDMDAVLVRISQTVETRLKEAKTEIAHGKKEIRAYVESLPKDLQKAGQEAEKNISSKFDELQEGVDAKKNDLAQNLARRYQESRDKLDERIKELQAENKGLVDGFIAKIKEIIEILRNFKERIGGMLRKAGGVLRKIIKDPIGFLGKLLDAVKQGFDQFSKNILTHLKAGLTGWLFGALASAGIEIPSEFNLKAIFGLVMQILGVTKDRIRAKVVKLIGAKNVERIEKAWEWVSKLISEGPAGLWEKIKEYLGNLKEMVMGGIRDWVVTQVVKQAVLWVISLFNPASALLKAIQAIYGVIMFFVERIDQILQLVESVIESVAKIVGGQIGEAANWIEKAMGRTVPLIISFLANLLGLTGVSEKIKSIIAGIQQKVDKAIDKVIAKIVGALGKLFRGGKGGKAGGDAQHASIGRAAAKELAKKPDKEMSYDELRKVKEKQAKDLETKYNRQLKKPVKLKITFTPRDSDIKDSDLDFNVHVGPNDFNVKSAVPGGGIKPEVGLHGDLRRSSGKKGQESHHVPPKGLLKWLVTQAKAVKKGIKKSDDKKELLNKHTWIDQLSKIKSDVYDPGDPLAAISINKHTHIKKRGKALEDVWRAHFGEATAEEVRKRLSERFKAKGLPLIYRLKFKELSEEDKKKFKARAKEADESIPEAVGETERGQKVPSTQFFHTELNAALQAEQEKAGEGVEAVKKALRRVAKAGYLQSNEAVTVALENSKEDGTVPERKDALNQLKSKSSETWNKYEGVKDLNIF